MDSPYFLVFGPFGSQSEFHLRPAKSSWTVGRGKKCDLQLRESDKVSRSHLIINRVYPGEDIFRVTDLGSTNGTLCAINVNGVTKTRPLTAAKMLRAGDRLHIGEYTLQFVHSLDREDEEGTVCGDDPGTEIHHLDRIVTTLMVDIRGYSQLCITVAPDIMDKLMDEWISTLGEIVQANGSTIDKFIGDAVMSGWVHPPNKPATLDSALNALRQIVKATQAIGQKYEVNLRIGAGISTGRAKVGFYGEQDYTAMGDAINLAERLEKATKELGSNVCICEASYEVSDLLKLRRATIVVKGIGQVTCWHGMFDDI